MSGPRRSESPVQRRKPPHRMFFDMYRRCPQTRKMLVYRHEEKYLLPGSDDIAQLEYDRLIPGREERRARRIQQIGINRKKRSQSEERRPQPWLRAQILTVTDCYEMLQQLELRKAVESNPDPKVKIAQRAYNVIRKILIKAQDWRRTNLFEKRVEIKKALEELGDGIYESGWYVYHYVQLRDALWKMCEEPEMLQGQLVIQPTPEEYISDIEDE